MEAMPVTKKLYLICLDEAMNMPAESKQGLIGLLKKYRDDLQNNNDAINVTNPYYSPEASDVCFFYNIVQAIYRQKHANNIPCLMDKLIKHLPDTPYTVDVVSLFFAFNVDLNPFAPASEITPEIKRSAKILFDDISPALKGLDNLLLIAPICSFAYDLDYSPVDDPDVFDFNLFTADNRVNAIRYNVKYVSSFEKQKHVPIKPKSYLIGNSHPYNLLTKISQLPSNAKAKVPIFTDKKTKEEVSTLVQLEYNGDDFSLSNKAITPFDRMVYNTISTLWHFGNRRFTATDVFKAMNGYSPSTVKVRASQIERVEKSLRKLMSTLITFDIKKELEANAKLMSDDSLVGADGIISRNLLQASYGKITLANGKVAMGIEIEKAPVLYAYNLAKKNIITVPISMLNTGDAVSNTDSIMVIREYLAHQIALMKAGERNNKHIRYDTLYTETGVEAPSDRTLIKRSRDQIKKLLDCWVEQKYIKGYSDYMQSRKIIGISIDC